MSRFTLPSLVAVLVVIAAPAQASGAASSELPRLALDGALLEEATLLAQADDEEAASDEEGGDAAAEPSEGGVQYGGQELGDVVGGATGFVFKRGFYTQSDLGGFFRLFGYTDDATLGLRKKPVYYSNLQPYIGLSVGYDVLDFLAVQASVGSGFVANAAPIEGDPDSPRDYGMIFTNLAVVGSWNFFDRYVLAGKVFGGGTFLTPAPALDAPFYGGDVGLGVGLQYATLLTDVVIGLEVNSFFSFFPDGGGGVLFIPGFNFAPIIKYVF